MSRPVLGRHQIGILVYRLILVLVSQKRPNGWYDSVGRQLHSGAVPVSTPGTYLCLVPAKNQPGTLIPDRSHQAVHSQFFPVRNGKPKNHQKRTKQEFVQESKLVALPTIPTRLPPTCTQFNKQPRYIRHKAENELRAINYIKFFQHAPKQSRRPQPNKIPGFSTFGGVKV
jgi:hypothetical protein